MVLLTKKGTRNRTSKKSRMTSPSPVKLSSALAAGPSWTSFERFRVQGASALSQIKLGAVGTLTSQGQQFRLLHENDFQQLVGLAREIDRARQGLRVIHAAVRTVQEHPGSSSLNTLVEAALLLSESPALPIRRQFGTLYPEDEWLESMPKDGEDEVEMNPEAVRRPMGVEGTAYA